MCFLIPEKDCNEYKMDSNNFTNGTTAPRTAKFYAFTIFGSCLSTWVMFSNAVIIIATFRNIRLKTRTGYFIASLALADFLNGFFNFSTGHIKAWTPKDKNGTQNVYMCGFYVFAMVFPFIASIVSLLCIALDRYLAIVHPLKSRTLLTKSRSAWLILISWIISFVASLPNVFWNQHHEGQNCTLRHMAKLYYFIIFNGVFGISLLLKFYMYIRVILTLRKNFTTFKLLQQQRLSESAANNMQFDKKSLSSESRVTQLVILVLILFLVCWLPMIIMFNVYFGGRRDLEILTGSISFLGFIHSGINFFLYLVRSPEYRRAFGEILCCCCKKPKGAQQSTSASTGRSDGTNESSL